VPEFVIQRGQDRTHRAVAAQERSPLLLALRLAGGESVVAAAEAAFDTRGRFTPQRTSRLHRLHRDR
jgi:hypothetical protein